MYGLKNLQFCTNPKIDLFLAIRGIGDLCGIGGNNSMIFHDSTCIKLLIILIHFKKDIKFENLSTVIHSKIKIKVLFSKSAM